MRVPLSWLAEYVDLPEGVTAEQVSADLVKVGLEEESVFTGDITGPLVVGRVLAFDDEPQKNGKVIRWVSLDVGRGEDDPQQVVCGAHNFAVSDLVVVVLPGAVLPGGFEISARKTYGHVSAGMICSARELGLGEDHSGIIVLSDLGLTGEPGDDALELLKLSGLPASGVEVNVTPDRGYCFSVRGIAREYAHATGRCVAKAFRDPADLPTPAATKDGFPVLLRDDAPIHGVPGCGRYVARVVRGVDGSAQAPFWMRRRLQQAGMRPISLVVDVTNYVMLALGQPLHAFDLAQLEENIVVRRARPGERMVTLDGNDRALATQDLLICDGTDGARPIAIAGVMGGAATEVVEETTDVLIESAWFDPISIARSARRHKLPSEAGRRFERGVDTALQAAAAQLAVQMLVEYGGGVADPQVTDVGEPVAPRVIMMSADLPTRVAGVDYSAAEVKRVLTEIGCTVKKSVSKLKVTPPTWRPDLAQPVDLVEEIARITGYDRIPSVLPQAPPGTGLTFAQRARRRVADQLADLGLTEVLSYPFVSAELHDAMGLAGDDPRRDAVRLVNPLSDAAPLMRTDLLSSLFDVVRRNVGRGAPDVAVFETGLVVLPGEKSSRAPIAGVQARPSDAELAAITDAVPVQPWHVAGVLTGDRIPQGWWGAGRPSDHTDAIELALNVCGSLGVRAAVRNAERAPWHPGRCAEVFDVAEPAVVYGYAGQLHPKAVHRLELPTGAVAFELDLDLLTARGGARTIAEPVLAFPVAKEDIALVVADDVPVAEVAKVIREAGGELLESVRLFDVYTGQQIGSGRRSLAFSLRTRAADRTLTAIEIAEVRDRAVDAVCRTFGATLRA